MSKPKRIALVDADIVLYRACMTAQYTVYIDPERNIAWRYKKLVPEESRDRLISIDVVESPEKAVDTFKGMLQHIFTSTNATHSSLFLSPSETFRHKGAVTLPYKGNRADRGKPMYFELLTKIAQEHYGAIMCDDIEADDALGIMQTHYKNEGVSSVICSDDKDLKMISGDHFNIRTAEQQIVSPAAANRQFAIQLLMGDATDNIQGLTRVGIKTAEKILKDVEPANRVQVIKEKYKKQFKEQANARFKENVMLLKILKKLPKGKKMIYDKALDCLKMNLVQSADEESGFTAQ